MVLRRRCATLSIAEQANVRALLQVLRVKLLGHNWRNVEQALPVSHSALAEILAGRVEISTTIASASRRRSACRCKRCSAGGGSGRR